MPHDTFILVHLVEDKPDGYRFKRSRHDWPLHITLLPWFTGIDEETLKHLLDVYASEQEAFYISVGRREQFGLPQEVAVNLIVEQERMRGMHDRLLSLIQSTDATFVARQTWIGAQYRAHITVHAKAERNEGDRETMDTITLIRNVGTDICEVVQTWQLGLIQEDQE